ncbi:hypothetical protein BKA07_001081 [Brevibacterium marinum]|uniref:Uncharacterized protein n=1 Tax=Brevibacterium marinum TaxID=418643 RepID=A0A846RVQ4_9MICO|nr:hypothetical protein [Brevibacterium marinum]
MDFGLEPSPRFIKLGPDEGNDMERVHDRYCLRQLVGGGLLVPGEGIHRDVIDAGPEVIGLVAQPVAEGFSRAAGDDVEQSCWPGREINDDSHPPVDAAVGPAVFIDTDRGHTIKAGSIGEQEATAEVEDRRAHGVPRGGEVLRDDVDAHLVDDYGLQSP